MGLHKHMAIKEEERRYGRRFAQMGQGRNRGYQRPSVSRIVV